jgi:hypothetical protein
MGDLTEGNRLIGNSLHIGDCYVWAEIYYLDSQTSYRECLPQKHRNEEFGELVMLDSVKRSHAAAAYAFSLFAFCLGLMGLAAYLLFLMLA